jgi:predicted amidophosphoribosyltransferase
MQRWTFNDIFEVLCPHCKKSIEFWKDEPVLVCPGCKKEVRNPRLDLSCAEWCQSADECLGLLPGRNSDFKNEEKSEI